METKAATCEELVLMNLPTNDLAYTNKAYVHSSCSLLRSPDRFVKIGYRYVFQLEADDRVAPGTIGLSSLQREPIRPIGKLAEKVTVHAFDPQDAPPAVGVRVVYEPVAYFKVQVSLAENLGRVLPMTWSPNLVPPGFFAQVAPIPGQDL